MEDNINNKTYFLFNELHPKSKIYKYMDLDYFLCMVKEEKFFISKKNCFDDMNETNLPFKYILPICAVGDKQIPDYSCISEEVKKASEKWKAYKDTSEWPTSCWTLRNDENYLMWKTYCSKFGVRISTTIDKFINSITPNDYYILCGRIQYKGYHSGMDIEPLMFSKNRYYSNEEEFRFYFMPKSDIVERDNINLPIKLKDKDNQNIITEIILSPFIKDKAAEEIRIMLNGMTELKNCSIALSKIKIKK